MFRKLENLLSRRAAANQSGYAVSENTPACGGELTLAHGRQHQREKDFQLGCGDNIHLRRCHTVSKKVREVQPHLLE